MTVTSWDDLPVHQSADWIAHVATSDRNFYDRYYFDAFDLGGGYMAVFGLGQYPNLGTTDAYVSVRVGDEQHVVRSSRPLGDRADLGVGPIRVEVVEPLRRLRVVCEPTEHTVAADLTWEGFGPAVAEPNQFVRQGARVTWDTQRFAQMGSWSGTLEVAGQTLAVDPATTWGARDRSWGVRPIGEKEPEGILAQSARGGGMGTYFPMRFDDHCIFYVCSESVDGTRTLEQADRVWLDGRVEHLGRTDHDHHFSSTVPRLLERSTISFLDAGFDVEVTSILPNFLALGTGYGLEPDWRHGMYQGPETVVQGVVYPVEDIAARGARAVVDHAGRFTYEGHVGYGLYEHSFSGVNRRYGLE